MRAGRVIRCACAAHVVENHFHYARRHAHPIAADLPAELIAIDCRAKGAQVPEETAGHEKRIAMSSRLVVPKGA